MKQISEREKTKKRVFSFVYHNIDPGCQEYNQGDEQKCHGAGRDAWCPRGGVSCGSGSGELSL